VITVDDDVIVRHFSVTIIAELPADHIIRYQQGWERSILNLLTVCINLLQGVLFAYN